MRTSGSSPTQQNTISDFSAAAEGVYKGGVGPMFFRPKEWEAAIARYLSETG